MTPPIREATCAYCGKDFRKPSHRPPTYCSDNCRKRACDERHRASCVDCGATLASRTGWPNAAGSPQERCRPCVVRQWDGTSVEATAAVMYAAGLTCQEVADEVGLTKDATAGCIARKRAEGWDIPYRRTPEQVERIKAGWQASVDRRMARRAA